MALPVNKIDTNQFLSLTGDPAPLRTMVETHARAGVDGLTIARLGKRGIKFTLQSKADFADRQFAIPLDIHDLEIAHRDRRSTRGRAMLIILARMRGARRRCLGHAPAIAGRGFRPVLLDLLDEFWRRWRAT